MVLYRLGLHTRKIGKNSNFTAKEGQNRNDTLPQPLHHLVQITTSHYGMGINNHKELKAIEEAFLYTAKDINRMNK
jgi:hypothetical protein